MIGSSEASDFYGKYPLSLLDIMLACIDRADVEGFQISGATLSISYYEGDTLLVTRISPEILEGVIYSALIRIDSAYQDMGYTRAQDHYFQAHVAHKIQEWVYADDDM